MSQTAASVASASIIPPHGLDEIIATFGDIFSYLHPDHALDPRWQAEQLVAVALPFPLVLAWDRSRQVTRLSCHKLLGQAFTSCFGKIANAGLQPHITSFGGCFSFRPQRSGNKLSAHSWGIAIDLNPETNGQGTAGNMHPAIISIFCEAGFTWGGKWLGSSPDPMHFQFCTGY